MKRLTLLVAALATLLTAAAVVPSLTGSAGAADDSQVYVVHGIPDTPVDVYLDGNLAIGDFQPKAVEGPLAVPAGDHRVQIFAHMTDPPETAPSSGAVIDATQTVPAGKSVSLIANLDESGAPALNAFVNDLGAVAAGEARVTVRHTAAAPAVDIVVDGESAVTDLANPDQAVADIPTGSHEIAVQVAGTDTTVIGPVTLDFTADTNTIIYAIGSAQDESLAVITQVLDTSAEQTMPTTPPTEPEQSATTAPARPAAPMHTEPSYTG